MASTTIRNISRASKKKKKLTHKVEEYTEGSAEIYKKIFGNIPERFREEKDFREIEYLENVK